MSYYENAKAIRALMNFAGEKLTDAEASKSIPLYPTLRQDGSLVKMGTRIQWSGALKRAAVDLWDTAENNPDNAPNLWEDILYKDGIRIIPAVITVGTAFTKDELGWWGDVIYRSKVGANVYTPEQYPPNWEIV